MASKVTSVGNRVIRISRSLCRQLSQILSFHWLPDLTARTLQLKTLLFTIKLSEISITTSLDLLGPPLVCAWAWEPAVWHSRSLTLHLSWHPADPCASVLRRILASAFRAFWCCPLQQGTDEIHAPPQNRGGSPHLCLVLPWRADVQRWCAFPIKVTVCFSQLDWDCFPSALPFGSNFMWEKQQSLHLH